jgi:hypothetical protein
MQSKIERQVMASVAVVYTVRKLISRTAIELYVLALATVAMWRLVWVHRVLQNFSTEQRYGLSATGNYLLVAVEHTQVAVQLTLLVAACAFVALVLDFARSAASRQMAF